MTAFRTSRQGAAVVLTLAAGIIRLLTNALGIYNFNPTYAGCTFGSARIQGWTRYALPVLLWIAGDFIFWAARSFDPEYTPITQGWWWINMLSLGAFLLIGRLFIGESRSWGRIGAASVLGSLQFFVITNFGSWLTIPEYAKTLTGLATCYMRGLEFAWPTLLANLIFTPAWFAMHEWATQPSEASEPAPETAIEA